MCFRPPTAQKKENKCPKCETVNEPEASVCSNCGAELPKLPLPPGVAASAANLSLAPDTPAPKASPAPPKAPPTPPKAPLASPKKPGE